MLTTTVTTAVEPLSYSISDAAAASGLSVRTLYNLIDAGKLERIHVGRRALIPAASLRALVGAQES